MRNNQMKNTLFMTGAAVLLSLAAAGTAKADGAVYPGNPDEPKYDVFGEKYKGHVVEACCLYMEAVTSLRHAHASTHEQERKERVAAAKAELIKRVETYPNEINDAYWGHGELVASPLYAAVYGNDVELVQYMLKKGALPFMPEYCYDEQGISEDVKSVLYHARAQYNVLEIFLQAGRAGIKLEGDQPSRHRH